MRPLRGHAARMEQTYLGHSGLVVSELGLSRRLERP